jgi:hypothetical protein
MDILNSQIMPAEHNEPKQPWPPTLVELDIKRIAQQMSQDETELFYYIANNENAFRVTNASSDHRLKEDARDFSGLELLNGLKVYDYAWKSSGTQEHGVMAHELQQELPHLVTGNKDEVDENSQPRIQRVNYAKLVPVLLRAIQEQQEMISELREQVETIN